VHHVRVALDEHQLVDLHAAELAHAAHVVAAQVDQHHVLGALLFVVQHLLGQRVVFGLGCAARARSGDGPVLHLALMHAHQQLRRRARQLQRRVSEPFDFLERDCFGGFGCRPAQRTLRREAQERTCRGWD
jgi:hypothetical protein